MEACDQQTLESWLLPSELEEPLEPPNALPLREGKSLMMWFVPKQQTLRLVPEYVWASPPEDHEDSVTASRSRPKTYRDCFHCQIKFNKTSFHKLESQLIKNLSQTSPRPTSAPAPAAGTCGQNTSKRRRRRRSVCQGHSPGLELPSAPYTLVHSLPF